MARKPGLKEQLEYLAELDPDTLSDEQRRKVLSFLDKGHPRLVAKAVNLVSRSDAGVPLNVLTTLFDRCMADPVGADPGCEIKVAVIKTLDQMKTEDPGIHLRAVQHIQRENAYPEPIDTAAGLRGIAFAGLVWMGYREIHFLAVKRLVDPEPETRQLVVQAMGHIGSESAELLLRMKLATGDPDTGVLGDCFSSLMLLEPDRSLELAAAYLKHADTSLVSSAALAIGESRHEKAFSVLRKHWDAVPTPYSREELLLPMALIRDEDSRNFLISLLEEGNNRHAQGVFQALRFYRGDQAIRDRIELILKTQGKSQWNDYYRNYFDR